MDKLVLGYDPKNGELYADGISSTIDQRDNEGTFQRELESIVGPVAKGLMYNAAKNLTRDYMASYFRTMNDKGVVAEKLLAEIMSFLQRRGMGVFKCEAFSLEKGTFNIQVRNSFNSMGYSSSKKPICYATSGMLAGILEPVVKSSLVCTELKCSGMGHEYCEFELKPDKKNTFPKNYLKADPIREIKGLVPVEVDYDAENGLLIFEDSFTCLNFRAHDSLYQREFEKTIGPAVRGLMYYYAGKYSALQAMSRAKRLIIKVISAISVKSLADEFAKRIPQRGYGLLENLKIDKKKKEITFDIKNCYNTLAYKKTKEPICYAFSGVSAGSTSLLFNEDSDCIETECRATGHKVCKFKTFVRKKHEVLRAIISELNETPGIRGSIILYSNGVIKASALPEGTNPDKVGARIGIIAGTGQNASKHTDLGKMDRIYINSSDGMLITVKINPDIFLSVLVREGVNKGIIELAIDRAKKHVARFV